jgi:hypothetical protein
VMAPVAGLPPGMPLMLHVTVASVAPVTVALKVCVLPKSSETVAGLTVTLMEDGAGVGDGGGGDWTPAEIPPPQPAAHATVAKRTRIGNARECGWNAG